MGAKVVSKTELVAVPRKMDVSRLEGEVRRTLKHDVKDRSMWRNDE
jgi:hypothetical protein